MNFDEYQAEALKTLKPGLPRDQQTMYFGCKMAEEVGEIVGPLAKNIIHGKTFEINNLKKELGDLLYYIAVLAANYNISFNDVANSNIVKLRERHGTSYKPEHYKP